MTTVLITGADGQVGLELMRAAWPSGVNIHGYNRAGLDITDRNAVHETIGMKAPSVVVNAAAYTAVDRAEQEPEAAFAANATAVGYLATAASHARCMFIHLSTDYVFDGTKDGPYVESDPISPLGIYGRSKAEGERAAAAHDRHLILRTSWVYGALGSNFVSTMLRLAKTKDELRVVDDQVGCPTAASDIAAAIVRIVSTVGSANELGGLYHLASPQAASWYEFAAAILAPQIAGGHLELAPIATSEYPTPAPRPANSRLDSNAIQQAAGIHLPDWSQSLPSVTEELCHNLTRSAE